MKEYIKTIIDILIFVLLIFVCIKLYDNLSNNYNIQELANEEQLRNSEEQNETQNLETENNTKQKATNFVVTDINGKKVNLSDYIGKPVVVNFWATWCGPCKSELPAFDKLCKEYKNQVEFMMVDLVDGYQETVENSKKFISQSSYEFSVFFDTEFSASNAYKLYSIPQTIFVDKEGNIVNYHIGAMSEQTLKQYIEILMGG